MIVSKLSAMQIFPQIKLRIQARCSILWFLLLLLPASFIRAQSCFTGTGGCQDYSNFGVNSVGRHAADLEYDNFTSSLHTTIVRDIDGNLVIWGQAGLSNGGNALIPTVINQTNFPGLTGIPLKAATGSWNSGINAQNILLTDDNKLWAWGNTNTVLSSDVKPTAAFGSFNLPAGVAAANVKMMFVTSNTIALTACDGYVYVLTRADQAVRGDGSTGPVTLASRTTWAKVQKSTGGDLTGVVATRGCSAALFALDKDGNLWTWGLTTWDGIAAAATRNQATPVTLPGGSGAIKMIGMTGTYNNDVNIAKASYYVLYENGSLYAMGHNNSRQLGDWTATNRPAWIQPLYAAGGAAMNDIAWVSPNEHDYQLPFTSVITTGNKLYNWGLESGSDMGRGANSNTSTGVAVDPGAPAQTFFETGDNADIIAVETGGHTTMILRKCETNFGYLGHKVFGSMGDGTAENGTELKFTFATKPMQVCGAQTLPVIQTAPSAPANNDGNYYIGTEIQLSGQPSNGSFTLTGGAGIATLAGNKLMLKDAGTVTVAYDVGDLCGTVTKTFTVISQSLPVTFGPVSAVFKNNDLVVTWTTETETDNDHFNIEASADGAHFINIGSVQSLSPGGNSKEALHYQFRKTVPANIGLALGIGLLALGGLGGVVNRKRRVPFILIMLLGSAIFYAGCVKKETLPSADGKLYIRVVQVDKDGTSSCSKVVAAVNR